MLRMDYVLNNDKHELSTDIPSFNADSYALFATATYLSDFNWRKGNAAKPCEWHESFLLSPSRMNTVVDLFLEREADLKCSERIQKSLKTED